ncbi:alpha-2-antiplasmin isoform X2 [Denticeps clupeoides]|uniref:Serpin domain-containing protein n=1 Tax=Denticeps clupeoides TaxID=299321 RepID=A0AAY4ALJ8_9TELE|nr:alpha-2-antiplasmin-like isoform X2 [Denticeps clupeoides]XP_028839987.1 alpha-2-antiplasmin-like isoform X2 [Denticeps clupeoides]XP_028839988.1 alpha-2-antiplasmin-like isoform X2 [Denticeps clupeoides]
MGPYVLILLFSLFCHVITEEPAGDEGLCGEVLSVENQRAMGVAVAKLGLQLLEHLQPSPEEPNVLISPLSISLALSQLALGARKETEEQLLQALHVKDLPCHHEVLSSIQQQLNPMITQVASRLYLRAGFQVKDLFLQESLRLYKSGPATLSGVEAVNHWVEETTKGHMKNFLSTIPANVVLILINAVHFKGEWESRFEKEFTSKELFYVDSKKSVEVDMMVAPKYPLSMLVDEMLGAQVARFRFQNDTSFLVVMPLPMHENVSTVAAKLNISDLYDRLPAETTMQVKLPKLSLEYKKELQEALSVNGLGSLFSGPDLSGITNGPLQVSSVQHASAIQLNEEGAEASAATSIHLLRSIPMFTVNMPFFFALTDDTSHVPLFLGIVTNPSPGAELIELNDEPQNDGPAACESPQAIEPSGDGAGTPDPTNGEQKNNTELKTGAGNCPKPSLTLPSA